MLKHVGKHYQSHSKAMKSISRNKIIRTITRNKGKEGKPNSHEIEFMTFSKYDACMSSN